MIVSKIEFIEQFKSRTKLFALRVIKLYQALPKTEEARIIGKQLLRSSTSVAANYRAVNRARSKAEYIAKLGIVVEEADESLFWIELLIESNIMEEKKMIDIKKEATEILSILAKARKNSINKKV
jgi:four helix bundle protein